MHGRSGQSSTTNPCPGWSNDWPTPAYGIRSLVGKTIAGPGIPGLTWSYAWGPANGFAYCPGTCPSTKTLTVTDPRGYATRYTFGNHYQVTEGQLQSVDEGWDGTNALRTTTSTYRAAGAGPYLTAPGYSTSESGDDLMQTRYLPLAQRTITQQGVTFNWQATTYDTLARLAAVTRSSSLGYARSESTTYSDNKTKWVMGQVASQTIGNLVPRSTNYDVTTALPLNTSEFGKLKANYAFWGDGTLRTLTDGLGHVTTYSNYMRGLAQNILYADGSSEGALVNNLGLITKLTNAAGTFWSYGYDAIGRLSSITPPAGDPVAYNPTTLAYQQVASDEYGLGANHWRQTITTGNAVTVNYFDGMLRKRISNNYDVANTGGTQRMTLSHYDADNRNLFTSYPARNIASITATPPGTTSSYDALGRNILTQASSELGTLNTSTAYLSGFQTRVTNPRNYTTTTAYQVFDQPSESAPTSMAGPETLSVTISRDVFGKPLSITRSGSYAGASVSATRSYVYDANQLLCKTIEPEIGATLQSLDAANNVAWRAIGLALPSTTSCDTASAPATSKIAYTYDARNRLTGTGYGDASPAIGRSYTPDGLPATVLSNGSTWTYSYNNRRLLTQESLAYGQTFNIGWGYDANGHTSQLTYPDNTVVSYAPNALGEDTLVSGYASGVTYHPNGAVAGYTLANGIVHSLTQNTRGLPLQNRDAGVMQDLYAFDANANVNSITDQQEGVSTRQMGYDGLDRLIVANAANVWGGAQYNYDPLDNLRVSVVGARSSNHNYDASNRLSTINTNGVYTGYVYDTQGNITGRGGQGFFFDQGNRMTLANNVASYAYDGLGRRVASYANTGLNKLQVYGQAGQLLYETRQQAMNTWRTRYVYLGDKLIAEVDSSAGTSYVHTDALGSPVAKTNSAGALLSRTRYEAYGKTAAGTNPNGIGFTGHVNDADTGLVYMQQRYYDPVAGRFLSVDPVVTDANTGGSFNRYEYAVSNPYRYTDPEGKFAIPLLVPIVQAVVQAVVSAVTSNVGAAAVGIAGGAALGAAIHSGDAGAPGSKEGTKAAAPSGAAGSPGGNGDGGPEAKSRNKPPPPMPEAEGRPHSIIEEPGKDGQYTTHNGDGTSKQYRGSGRDHGGIPRPNVKESGKNVAPDGREFVDKGRVRPVGPGETPGG